MFETYPCHCAQDLVIILLYEHFAGKKKEKTEHFACNPDKHRLDY